MNEDNLFCEERDCCERAYMFGLQNSRRPKVCRAHLFVLTDKKLPVFDIAAHQFINSLADVKLYEERRTLMQRGLGHVSALEIRCDSNFGEAQSLLSNAKAAVLSVIERSFREVELTVMKRVEEVKAVLLQASQDIQRLTLAKEVQLSPSEMALCENLPAGPLFRLAYDDCKFPVVEAILTRFQLLPGQALVLEPVTTVVETLNTQVQELLKTGKADMAEEAARFAETLGAPPANISASDQREKCIKKLPFLLRSTVSSEEVEGAFAILWRQAMAARAVYLYPRCIKKLEKLRSLQSSRASDSDLCLALGQELTRLARFQEADHLLRTALLHATVDSRFSVSIGNAIAEAYYQSGRYEAAVEAYNWNRMGRGSSLEALHFLTNSLYWLGRYEEGLALAQTSGELSENAQDRCVQVCIRGGIAQISGDCLTATHLYEEAWSLQVQPSSYLVCCMIRDLAVCYESLRKEKALELYLQAAHIFACHFPLSYDYAKSLCYLGDYYHSQKQDKEAEPQYKEALKVLSVHYQYTMNFPLCLTSLGEVYEASSRPVEAEEQWVQACEVFHAHYPRTLEFARCLCRLGVLYCSSQRLGFAEDMWLKALAILSVMPESLEMASCLNNLGAMYETQGRKQEAVQRTDESLRIYTKLGVSKQVTDSQARLQRLRS